MSIRIFRLFTLFLMLGFTLAHAEVWTQSTISTNTTWQKNNSTGDGVYVIDLIHDTLTVSDYATLTIEPGVTVKFHDDIIMLVYGVLNASGVEGDSIRFVTDDGPGNAGEWRGIKFLTIDSTDANQMRYCYVSGGDADGTGPGVDEDSKNGGGIYFGESVGRATVLANSIIENNHAYEGGGGVAIAGSPTIENTIIRQNSADQYGGGISMKGPNLSDIATPSITNSMILNNSSAGQGGGGIGMLSGAYLTMNNSLVYNNTASNGPGGGLYLYNLTTQATINNSIVRANTATSAAQVYGTANIAYSNIEGGYTGSGNIDADPVYGNPAVYDFSYDALSPIVDAGTNSYAPSTDFYGNSRPFDGDRDGTATSDMGPGEYQNSPPQISSSPQTAATEDQLYSYQAEATDPDAGESFTWSLVSGPSFLTMNASSGELSGTPLTDSDAGDHLVTIQVADANGVTDTQTFTLTVQAVNDAPVVSGIPDQTIAEGDAFATISLDDYVTDEEDADADISWTYSGNLQLNVQITNRVATITPPDADWYGSETITFTAHDPSGATDADAATFTITNVNDAPVVSGIPDQTIDEGGSFVQIQLDNYVNDIDNIETDLNWSYSGNSELLVSIDANRVATISTPNSDWFGAETITFTATDPGGLSDSDAALFTVNAVNDAPVVSAIPDQTIDEGQSFTSINLDDYVSDVDNLDSEISWQTSGNTDLSVQISADRVATISIPNADWFGAETITFTATDPGQLSSSTDVVFTVNNINDAPVAVDDAATTDEDVSVAISVTANDSDIENDNLTVQAVGTAANGTVKITSPTEVTYTPAADWSGSDSFTYTVSDGNGGTDQASVSVTVNAVNDAPVVSAIPDQTIDEGQSFTTINLDDYVSDVDNTDLEMSWHASGYTDLSVEISADRIATISIPDTDWFGAETITFTATDPGQLSGSTDVIFTVNNVNDAPLVTKPADQTIDEGAAFSVINLDDYVQDVDNSDAEMSWQADGNTELLVDVNENRQATVSTPNPDWFGSETVRFIASDPGGLSDTTSVQFSVQAINDAPQILTIADQTITEGGSFSPFDLDTLVTDVDDDIQSLTWQASGYQQLQVTIDSLQVVTVTIPDSNWFGSEAVTFTVTDTSAASDSSVVVFTVQPANDAPLVSQISGETVNEGQTFSNIALNDFVDDVDNTDDEINWTVNGSQYLQVSLDEQNVATIAPLDSNWFGNETLTFVANDPAGLSDSTTATFEVLAVNDAPQLTTIETQSIAEGQNFAPLNLDDFVQDVDDADSTLVWSVSGFNSLQFTLENRVLTVFTPSEDWNGSELAQLTVRDTSGLQDSIGVLFEVLAVNDSTHLNGPLPELSFAEDDSLWFARSEWFAYAEDKDNPDSTLQFMTFSGKHVMVHVQGSGFTYRAPADWFGVDSLWLTVSDGLTADSGLYVVDVRPVNDAPQIVNLPQSAAFERDTTLVLEMNNYRQDVDTPDSLLSWSFAVSNDSLLYEWVAESGQLTLSALRFAGDVDLICTLTDDSLAVARDTIVVTVSAPTAIGDETMSGVPQTFALQQNFPNPFNPSTTIGYQLPKATEVQLDVFNVLGQKVATLVSGNQPAGYYKIRWQAESVANGVYFYKLQAGEFIKIRKMMLIK